MFDTVKQSVKSTTNFVRRHRVALAVVATTTVCVAVNRQAVMQYEQFLRDHGLYDEFYALAAE